MLKKTMLMAAMAVAAVAFAVPSVASAQWAKHGVAAKQNETVTFHGNALFTSAIGGVSCSAATSTTLLKPGTTGTVETFAPTIASCKGTGGLGGCTVTSITNTGLPWVAHTDTKTIEITTIHIKNTFHGAFCPYHELTLYGDVTATPDNLHHANHVTLSNVTGKLEAYNPTDGGKTVSKIAASGTLTVTPAGTYGITPT